MPSGGRLGGLDRSLVADAFKRVPIKCRVCPVSQKIASSAFRYQAAKLLALGDVEPSDLFKVLFREFRVGLSLGLLLGAVAFAATSVIYDRQLGTVIGLTLLSVCTMAATVGGAMPLLARTIRADPAVFSNPFITTFVDATGLLIYFLIAKAVLGI